MNHKSQSGEINILLVPLVLALLILIGAAAFAIWAYQGRQDYKQNVDTKVAAAVTVAKQQEDIVKDQQFAEQEKSPVQVYNGPSEFGSIVASYPKTWSVYQDSTGSTSSKGVDAYFFPHVVPSIRDANASYALRITVTTTSYDAVVKSFSSLAKQGKVTVSAYALPKVPSVVGSRVDGQITTKKTGSMIILPLRDKTLQLWTESNDYKADFDNTVLPNFSFSP